MRKILQGLKKREKAFIGALHYGLLVMPLVLYVLFALMAAYPYLFNESRSRERDFYYYEEALFYARQPIQDTFGSLVFREHNPALFMAVLQLALRAGLGGMYQMHMLILTLNIALLVLLYLLIRGLFHNRWIALFSVLFILSSGAFRFFGISIHAISFGRLFSIAACLFYLYYLRRHHRWLLYMACAFYFLACWNYWERYVETGLLLWGIYFAERRRFFSYSLVSLALSALMALGSFVLVATTQWGGKVTEVTKELTHMAVLRSLDVAGQRYEHHHSFQYINLNKVVEYLQIIATKIETMYFITPALWALMLAAVLFTAAPERKRAYGVLPFAFAAAFYWHTFMYQHVITMPHIAYHHYVFMAIVFGCFIYEVPAYIYRCYPDRVCKAMLAGALIFPAVFPAVNGAMRLYLLPYVSNYNYVLYVDALQADARSEDPEIREIARDQLNQELLQRIKWQPPHRQDITAHVLTEYLPYRDDTPNLLINGGFESLKSNAFKMIQTPNAHWSVVQRDTSLVGEGEYAIRQTWNTDTDGRAAIFDHFAFVVPDLTPNTYYLLRAKAFNARGGEVIVAAWERPVWGNDDEINRLKLEVLRIPPSKGHALQQFTGVFRTSAREDAVKLFLVVAARESRKQRDTYVIWDDFELYELGPDS